MNLLWMSLLKELQDTTGESQVADCLQLICGDVSKRCMFSSCSGKFSVEISNDNCGYIYISSIYTLSYIHLNFFSILCSY